MNSKLKKALLTGLSLVLVAVISVAGTFAYLESTSDEVTNTFSENNVNVDLFEHDKDNNVVTARDDYDIIPGTSQDKDPTVKVTATLPVYVYVEVTDNTQGLVDYDIDAGWTLLENTDNVYYRVFTPTDSEDGNTAEFPVLMDNHVSYPADLTNEDMEAATDPIQLIFNAFAIQKEPFDDPYLAYARQQKLIMNEDELVEAIQTKMAVKKIGQDFTVSENNLGAVIEDEELVDIDLNGHTLTFTEAFYAGVTYSDGTTQEEHIKISNGNLVLNPGKNTTFCAIGKNSSMTLENVDIASSTRYNFYPSGEGSVLTIKNCNIKETAGGLIIGTNATNPYDCTINVTDSTLESGYTDGWTGTPVVMNVPGTLNITGSTIIGEKQAVAVRCGTAYITDSILSRPYALSQELENSYMNSVWGQANNCPFAALLIGNRSDTGVYQYPATVTLSNVTLTAYNENGVQGKTVYMYGNTADRLATLNYDPSNCVVGTINQGNENTVVNAG